MRLRPKKVRDRLAFDTFWSNRYFLLSRAKFPVIADEIAALARESDKTPRVLDAGIGRCRVQRLFLKRFPEIPIEWHGVDLHDFRLRIRDDVPGIHRIRASVDALPYPDTCFDAVVSSWVFQHLDDPERCLREHIRVLRPGGLLLIAVPNSPQPLKAVQERVHPWWIARQRKGGREFSYNPQIQFYDLTRVRRLLESAGAEPVRFQGVGFATGGPLSFLENHEWYYRANLWLGARAPRWTQQLIGVARRR